MFLSTVNVKYEVLLKIQKWLEHHKDSSSMEVDGDEGDDSDSETADQCKVSSWDAEFLKEDAQMLVAVMNAANFLNIEGLKLKCFYFKSISRVDFIKISSDLLTTCCKVIASLFHGKTASEIREILKITNDLSPEEVARIRKESAWLTQN